MPGHVKRGGSGDPDPDPLPFLIVSSSDRQKDLAKASFSFLLEVFLANEIAILGGSRPVSI